MTAVRQPSREDIKLLGELSAGSALKEERILAHVPDWSRLERQQILTLDESKLLLSLHAAKIRERANMLSTEAGLNKALLKIAAIRDDPAPLQYILTVYYDLIRDDTSLSDKILASFEDVDSFTPFVALLLKPGLDSFTADKAGFIISALIARARRGTYTPEQVQSLVDLVTQHNIEFTDPGRLDILKNILKHERLRELVWDTRGVSELILSNLDMHRPAALYPAVFCSWLLTFNSRLLTLFTEADGVVKICNVLRETKTEKVVRMCIHTLLNCLAIDESVEVVIQQDAVHTLTLLEYEKWRDEELYQEIRDGLSALQQKLKLFRNFDRYCRELATGKLARSFLHSEKFWHENVMHFEENEFAAVKNLVALLLASDSTTLAVACSDIGEFARLHPTGKKMLRKLRAKETIMMLMSHKDREVSREALLCTQKMMLDKWQDAAAVETPPSNRRG